MPKLKDPKAKQDLSADWQPINSMDTVSNTARRSGGRGEKRGGGAGAGAGRSEGRPQFKGKSPAVALSPIQKKKNNMTSLNDDLSPVTGSDKKDRAKAQKGANTFGTQEIPNKKSIEFQNDKVDGSISYQNIQR